MSTDGGCVGFLDLFLRKNPVRQGVKISIERQS